MFFFDTTSKTWQKIQINGYKPGGRACHSLTCVDKFLYMFGGFNGVRSFNKLEVFDIENNHWSALNDVRGSVPVSRDAHAMVVYKDSLYLYGGHDGENYLNDMYEFSIPNKTWTQILASNSIVNGIRGHSANCIGQNIYIFGGYDGKLRSNVILVYNIETRSWSSPLVDIESSAINFMSGRQRHSSNFYKNGEVIIFGGFDGKSMLNDVHFISVSLLEENIIKREALLKHQSNIRQLLFKEKVFADVEIIVKGKKIMAHKNLLVCQSKKFEAMFRSNMRQFEMRDKVKMTKVPSNVNPPRSIVVSNGSYEPQGNTQTGFDKKSLLDDSGNEGNYAQANPQISDLYNYGGVPDKVQMETNTGGNLYLKTPNVREKTQENDDSREENSIEMHEESPKKDSSSEPNSQNELQSENPEEDSPKASREMIENWKVVGTLKFEYVGTFSGKKNVRQEIQAESGKYKPELDFDMTNGYDEENSQSFLFDLNETKSNCEFNFKEKDENLLIYPRSSRMMLPNESNNFSKLNSNIILEGTGLTPDTAFPKMGYDNLFVTKIEIHNFSFHSGRVINSSRENDRVYLHGRD